MKYIGLICLFLAGCGSYVRCNYSDYIKFDEVSVDKKIAVHIDGGAKIVPLFKDAIYKALKAKGYDCVVSHAKIFRAEIKAAEKKFIQSNPKNGDKCEIKVSGKVIGEIIQEREGPCVILYEQNDVTLHITFLASNKATLSDELIFLKERDKYLAILKFVYSSTNSTIKYDFYYDPIYYNHDAYYKYIY